MRLYNHSLTEALEKLKIHDHLCLLYSTREEQLAAVIPFIRLGLEKGEKCVYIADENDASVIEDALRVEGVDVNAEVGRGALAIIRKRDAYLKEGHFDPDLMIGLLIDNVNQARAEGYPALRVTGEMTWALGDEPGVERLIEYESKLNGVFPQYDILAICQYNTNRFPADTILNIIYTHPLVVYGQTVLKNFYYIPTEEFLNPLDSRVRIERMLEQIQERERLEREAEEVRELNERTLASLDQAVFVVDPKTRTIVSCNDAVKQVFGYEKDEVIGRNTEFLHVDKEAYLEFGKELFPALNASGMFSAEYRMKRKDGGIFVSDHTATQMLSEAGERIGVVSVVRDVTRRKRAEEALERELEVNKALAGLSKALLASRSIEEISEIVLEEAKNLTGSRFGYVGYIDPRNGNLISPTMTRDVWEKCDVPDKSIAFEKFSGLFGWVLDNRKSLMTNSPSTDPRSSGTPEGHIPIERFLSAPAIMNEELLGQIALANPPGDYTEKDLEIVERLAVFYALAVRHKRSEEDLRTLSMAIGQSPAIVMVTDSAGVIEYVNPSFISATGYFPEEMIGKNSGFQDGQSAEQAGEMWKELTEDGIWKGEFHNRKKNGERYWESATISAIKDDDGRVIKYLKVAEDVTERKEYEQKLEETNTRLREALENLEKSQRLLIRQEKLASLGELSAGVAHELKNPLNIISTSVQLLMMDEGVAPEVMGNYETVMEQVSRSVKIIDNLRSFAREAKPAIKDVSLHDFLDKTLALVEYEMRVESIEIVRDYEDKPIMVKGDPDQLAQVFLNLINNAHDSLKEKMARRAAEQGPAEEWTGRMVVRTRTDGGRVNIVFEDNGIGLSSETAARVFDPFFTTKKEEEGTGMGLSIAFGIMQNHGGTIEVDGQEGKGAVFTVNLQYDMNG